MKNVTNRVPAEVFLWHPQQRQLNCNTPTKQRQSRNFKSLNNITNVNKIWNGWLLTSYSEVTINVQTAVPLLGHRPRNVSIRRARATVEFLRRETPAFIPPDHWPADILDINPIDYCIWGRVHYSIIYTRSRWKMWINWSSAWSRSGLACSRPLSMRQSTNGEDVSMSSKGAAVWTFIVTSEYDVASTVQILLTL